MGRKIFENILGALEGREYAKIDANFNRTMRKSIKKTPWPVHSPRSFYKSKDGGSYLKMPNGLPMGRKGLPKWGV